MYIVLDAGDSPLKKHDILDDFSYSMYSKVFSMLCLFY